ncbi:hypothetical protein BJY52DRAFT_1228593 [Lactarius psammicola]|nr:hypothetical protein BJY52DRAFT_1228593 [Lactarius psammicola]
MNLMDPPPHTTEVPPLEPNSEPVPREKSTTTARVAISSGPAASVVEARKGKKKRSNKNPPQAEGQKAASDGGNEPTIPDPPPSTPTTTLTPMLLSTPPATQNGLATPYPLSEHGGTPPPIVLPAHLKGMTPSPLTSPTRHPTTSATTPQLPFASLQDVEMSPASPPTRFGQPSNAHVPGATKHPHPKHVGNILQPPYDNPDTENVDRISLA